MNKKHLNLNLTFLHRHPLNVGRTARERGVIAKPNHYLDLHALAMKGDMDIDPPARLSHLILAAVLLLLLAAGLWGMG